MAGKLKAAFPELDSLNVVIIIMGCNINPIGRHVDSLNVMGSIHFVFKESGSVLFIIISHKELGEIKNCRKSSLKSLHPILRVLRTCFIVIDGLKINALSYVIGYSNYQILDVPNGICVILEIWKNSVKA